MIEGVYETYGGGTGDLIMIGLSPSDNNSSINAYKQQHNLTLYAAGTEGGGPAAIDVVTDGQNFLGYPTYCVVCPDKDMSFDVCWPPTAPCFDPYIQDCMENTLAANFTADITEFCQEGEVNFTDASVGNVTSWEWTFENGDPATSTDQNPVVNYSTPGSWDVSLTVSDGTDENTIEMPDYITVFANPDVTLGAFDTACLNWPAFELTGGMPVGGEYSGTGVSNGWFDPAVAGVGSHEITYAYTDENGCENSAIQTLVVDGCTSIGETAFGTISIYPNPVKNVLNIRSEYTINNIRIFNFTGQVVEDKQITNKIIQINTSNLKAGVYLLQIETGKGVTSKRIVIE